MRVFIALGSNLGDRKANLEKALRELSRIGNIRNVSSLYESEPLGYKDQDDFYNAVVEMDVELGPLKLLSVLKGIESSMGRKQTFKWGPRIIDLDILLYGDLVIDLPRLKIPHPEIKNRLFVLLPLLELDPEISCPKDGDKFSELRRQLMGSQRIKKVGNFSKERWCWDEVI